MLPLRGPLSLSCGVAIIILVYPTESFSHSPLYFEIPRRLGRMEYASHSGRMLLVFGHVTTLPRGLSCGSR
jgi:hypothetical protein